MLGLDAYAQQSAIASCISSQSCVLTAQRLQQVAVLANLRVGLLLPCISQSVFHAHVFVSGAVGWASVHLRTETANERVTAGRMTARFASAGAARRRNMVGARWWRMSAVVIVQFELAEVRRCSCRQASAHPGAACR